MECNFTLCRFNTEYEVSKKGICKCKTPERFCKYLQLEKENAELKRDKEDLIFVRNAKADHIIELKDQLTKAKEIISAFVEWANWEGSKCPSFKSIQDKAEQFLWGKKND